MGALLCLLGCSASPSAGDQVVPVYVHTIRACDVPKSLAEGNLELVALGDFAASNESAEVLPLSAAGATLPFPAATRALQARIAGPGSGFFGLDERLSANRFDLLLWPEQRSCSLFRPDGSQGYPGRHAGQALGFARARGVVLAAGGNDALVSDAIVGALSLDAHTGEVTAADTSEGSVLRESRAFATITELGERLLVAGGEHPVYGVPEQDIEPRKTAELFDAALGEFVGDSVTLQSTRTRHAAVTLQNGSTLLVGGRGRSSSSLVELRLAELISPAAEHSLETVTLAPRIEPRALVLSDGRVFVGGGYTADGAPAEPAGEWISADGLELSDETSAFPALLDRAFVATWGGGVLAVGGCELREPESERDEAECRRCRRGCPPRDGYDAWWLDPQDGATRVELSDIDAPQPLLLPGSDGSPWLIAEANDSPGQPRLFRFDAWNRRFVSADVAAGARLPRLGFAPPLAIDADTFVWLDDDGNHAELLGLRLGTRSRFAQDVALVLRSDPRDPSRPLHLVPDRPLGRDERYDGRLWLEPGGAIVAIADADFAQLTLQIKLAPANSAQGVPSSAPPRLLLGDTLLGGEACPWPAGDERGGDADVPTLWRRGARAELRFRGEERACEVPEGRLPLAVRGGDGVSVIQELVLERAAP